MLKGVVLSGEGGIRTLGTSQYTRFRDEHNRPLCHLSERGIILPDTGHKMNTEFKKTLLSVSVFLG